MTNRPFDLCDTSPPLSTRFGGPDQTRSRLPRGETTQTTKPGHGPPGAAALDSRQLSLCLVQGRPQPGLLCLGLLNLLTLGQDQRLGLAELLSLCSIAGPCRKSGRHRSPPPRRRQPDDPAPSFPPRNKSRQPAACPCDAPGRAAAEHALRRKDSCRSRAPRSLRNHFVIEHGPCRPVSSYKAAAIPTRATNGSICEKIVADSCFNAGTCSSTPACHQPSAAASRRLRRPGIWLERHWMLRI
jgi:hypothetical protein